jgi:hypothetical protein
MKNVPATFITTGNEVQVSKADWPSVWIMFCLNFHSAALNIWDLRNPNVQMWVNSIVECSFRTIGHGIFSFPAINYSEISFSDTHRKVQALPTVF